MRNLKIAALGIAILCFTIAVFCDGGNATNEYSIGEYLNSLKEEAVNKLQQEVAETKVTIDGRGNTVINNGNLSLNLTEVNKRFTDVTQKGIDLIQGNDTQTNMTTKLQNATLAAKEEVKKETISRYMSARK